MYKRTQDMSKEKDDDEEQHEETYTTDYHVFNDSVSAMGAKLKNTVRQRDNGEKRAEQDKYEIQKTHA